MEVAGNDDIRLKSIADVERVLARHVDVASRTTGKNITTERTLRLASLVGNPEKSLKAVHVAGTSGKTSTSYFIASMLKQAGKKVGLTVSPHVDSITERVQVDGKPLADETFCRYFDEFYNLIGDAAETPTYFELMIVFALWVFKKENVDYAVLETGMGGLHDSTNIVSSEDKLCIITDIGMDHMHVLGKTVEEIALQKVGIVWPGNKVVMYRQERSVMAVVERWVSDHEADLALVSDEWNVSASMLPEFQQRNWELAYQAYLQLALRDKLPDLTGAQQRQTQATYIPGRMEIIPLNETTLILDGAHNEQKMSTFFASFKKRFPDVRPTVLLALKQGKEIKAIAPLLAAASGTVVVTEFHASQDAPIVSMPADDIVKEINAVRPGVAVAITPLAVAWQDVMEKQADYVLVIGSFYLLGEVRRLLDMR